MGRRAELEKEARTSSSIGSFQCPTISGHPPASPQSNYSHLVRRPPSNSLGSENVSADDDESEFAAKSINPSPGYSGFRESVETDLPV
jgi:hypothetical protein